MPLSNKASSKPLPPCPGGFPAGTDLQRAFQVCKNFESKGQSLVFRPDDILLDFTPVCASRVLGFALLCSSSDRGRDNLATEILNCNDDHVLLTELAHLYVYGLIRVFYNPKTDTPVISIEQSPAVATQEPAAKFEHLLERPSSTAKELRKLVMVREGGFCPFSGRVDESMWNGQAEPDTLEVAHILSQPLSEGIKGGSAAARQKLDWAMTVGAVIENFGGFSTHVLLGSENLNNPRNAIMLAPISRKHFDRLDVWLIPFKDRGNVVIDKYKLNCAFDNWCTYFTSTVTFRTHTFPDGKKIVPPSPQLIALHAACAQITHMSGAAEHLEEPFRDTGPISVMTATPNSANELVHALKKVQLQHPTRLAYV